MNQSSMSHVMGWCRIRVRQARKMKGRVRGSLESTYQLRVKDIGDVDGGENEPEERDKEQMGKGRRAHATKRRNPKGLRVVVGHARWNSK